MLEKQKAFTLVEISIVIVIIALIIAGVTAGKSTVEAAKINAQAADLQMYSTAFNAFSLQYNALAGDMKNATNYWSGAASGNGNGKNDRNEDDYQTNNVSESRTTFEHLSRAKLIPGFYDSTIFTLGVGYPRLKLNTSKGMMTFGSLYTPAYANYQISSGNVPVYKNALYVSIGYPTEPNGLPAHEIGTMTPTQAYFLDKKIDDGIARKGNFKGYRVYRYWVLNQGDCLTAVDGDYLLSNTKYACQGEYILKR